MLYEIRVNTKSGKEIIFNDVTLCSGKYVKDGVILSTDKKECMVAVTVVPENANDKISYISHRITLSLRNFHTVIVPDCGRYYPEKMQLVDFWGFSKKSAVNNVCVPMFIFTGQDHKTSFAFGIVGKPIETLFRCLEPHKDRALLAYTKKLTLEISRGHADAHIPSEYSLANSDGSITEYLFLKDLPAESEESWFMTLRDFCEQEKRIYGLIQSNSNETLEPLWCSWTDWHSDNVTEEVILAQVEAGVELGIKNFIIDDGWFGPGLDSDFSIDLNIGDWEGDPIKIKDVKALSGKIRELRGRPFIWCAPHAVGDLAKCRNERMPLLTRDKNGALVETNNKFNILCVRSPKAREVMSDICVKLAVEFDTDGAKYDLYNCIPDVECCNHDHNHDTDSMVVGLQKLMELIWKKVRDAKPNYMVELKQNYGGSFLSQYGTMMRAGDTPYCPEGNFLRTAYVQAYTPFSINDYQTITSFDKPEDTAVLIIKMIAAGIPTYSMDITTLTQKHIDILKNYNSWYLERLERFKKFRTPLDTELNVWSIGGEGEDIYFLINSVSHICVEGKNSFTIMNGTTSSKIYVAIKESKDESSFLVTSFDCAGKRIDSRSIIFDRLQIVDIPVGGRVEAKY